MAGVVGLFIAARAGAPVTSRDSVRVTPGGGIEGDCYAAALGHWREPRRPDQELTPVEAEVTPALGITANALGRNVVTSDVRLQDGIGRRFRVGETLLEGVRRCDPCRYLDSLSRPGVAWALKGHSGLRARILTGGRSQGGDVIQELPPHEP